MQEKTAEKMAARGVRATSAVAVPWPGRRKPVLLFLIRIAKQAAGIRQLAMAMTT